MADLNTTILADTIVVASAMNGFRRKILLPANYADFPLAAGQIYGQVATNCRLSNSKAASNKGLMVRSHHRARGVLTEIAIVIPNWMAERASGKLEIPNDGPTQFTASFEAPSGTVYRFKFANSPREPANGGDNLISEFVPIVLANDAEFWSNIWQQAGTSVMFYNGATGQVSANGEKGTVSTTSVTDLTGGGGSNTAQTYGFWPIAIIGRTSTSKATVIISDSTGEGVGDTADSTDAVGMIARSIVSGAAYINLSQSGDRLELAVQSHARRFAMLPYARNAVFGLGVNDIGAGRTLAQIKADMISMWAEAKALLSGAQRVFQHTITPSTTSADSWTTSTQTAATNFSTAGNGTRELLNDWLRDGAPLIAGAATAIGDGAAVRAGSQSHPLYAVVEFADVVETARNSGKWKFDGTANKWTADGIHPSAYAYAQVAAFGALTAAMLA